MSMAKSLTIWRNSMSVAGLLVLAACNSSGSSSGETPAQTRREQQSQTHAELPEGMRLYTGQRGTLAEFQANPAGRFGGKIITYSTIGMPWDIRDFYEEEGKRLGLQVIGRVNAGDFQSIDLRRPQGDARKPHTISVMAVHKSDFTNVTINIDVTQ